MCCECDRVRVFVTCYTVNNEKRKIPGEKKSFGNVGMK